MSVKWTPQQQEAVDASVANILVTAAAGAGKTQVLTGRILKRILGGQDITRLLIVTFTNAAAAEMRGRISKALSDELRRSPQNTHVRRQLSLLPCAKITTIHAFCLNILRENFFEANLPASFRTADAAESTLLKYEAADECFEELYGEGNEDFICFADCFSTARSDEAARDAMLSVYNFSQSMPHPQKWLDDVLKVYDMPDEQTFEASPCAQIILKAAEADIAYYAEVLAGAAELCSAENGLTKNAPQLLEEVNMLREISVHINTWQQATSAADNIIFKTLRLDKEGDADAIAQIKTIRDGIKKKVGAALSPFAQSAQERALAMRGAYPAMHGMICAIERFITHYTQMKRDRGIIDFNDMEHLCIGLLENEDGTPSDIADVQRKSFDEIYIDEYQDSNDAQEYIFSLVGGARCGKPNIFMVGDLKQGIYGFRQTSPQLFAHKKDTYRQGAGEKFRKIVLTKNFRSSKNVIDFVNFIFSNIMSRYIGGVDYDDEETLVCGAPYPNDPLCMEINVIETAHEQDSDDEEADERTAAEAQGILIADKILSLVGHEKVYDLKREEYRDMKYSDIAVLSRRGKSFISTISDILTQYGIPSYSDTDSGFFSSIEVTTILSLLEVLDNPINDIALISVLRSPIFGFDENELAQIRLCDRTREYYYAAVQCGALDTPLSERCRDFLEKLKLWRSMSARLTCSELIDFLLDDTHYMDYVCGDSHAEERVANLRLLCEKARAFEETSYRGLYSFLNYIHQITGRGSDSGEVHVISENNDVVRLMTIHKSKGLEFPVVILADCGGKLVSSLDSRPPICHRGVGVGIPFINLSEGTRLPTSVQEAARLQLLDDNMSEEIRILYVALTRAKERIIVVGTVRNAEQSQQAWRTGAVLCAQHKYRAGTYLDYICSCAYLQAVQASPMKIDINIYTRYTLPTPKVAEPTDTQMYDEILPAKFDYKYKRLLEMPSKVTVTELKRLFNTSSDERAFEMFRSVQPHEPAFLQSSGKISPTQRGSLIHFVMQTIALDVKSEEDVRRHISSLTEQNIITREEAAEIPCDKILRFFLSPLGKRLAASNRVYREEPFTTLLPASYITDNAEDSDEAILAQGICDCYFFEGDNIVLIDFKTDRTSDTAEIKKRYTLQMQLYADVLQKKYFSKIYEKFIYLFENGGIIEM